jgi:outer membrane protein OmpA-like peptidoglycan-associated protein
MRRVKESKSFNWLSRKVVYAVLFVFSATGSAFAQSADEVAVSDRYLANNFLSDWFVGIGGGGRVYLGDHDRQMEVLDRLSFGGNLYIGKWWTSLLGTRVGYSYQQAKGLTKTWAPVHSTGNLYEKAKDDTRSLLTQKFNVGHITGDLLLNISNVVCGVNPDRFYTFVPYFGLGLAQALDVPRTRGISANVGLLNLFHVSEKIDLTLDFRTASFDDRVDGETGGRQQEGLLSVDLGLAYSFGASVYRPGSTPTAAEIAELNDKINAMNEANRALRERLTAAEQAPKVQTVVEKVTEVQKLASDLYVKFEIGKTTLTKEARVQLDLLVDVLKKYREETYTITGYADATTGSPARNAKLSRERTEVVKNYLVSESGIDASRLKINSAGGVENRFYNDPSLSRSVIISINR